MMNDEKLKEVVTDRLQFDPTLNIEGIEVLANDGIITLQGEVESRDDRKWIETLVWQVAEVRDVVNELAIDYDSDSDSHDVNHSSL